ncbi:MAG: hypothetical protein KJP15_09880, partial [Gammaproteobacteria bacterium]|nr:hypothetical protein [Gammaproteobacteria bacterium]
IIRSRIIGSGWLFTNSNTGPSLAGSDDLDHSLFVDKPLIACNCPNTSPNACVIISAPLAGTAGQEIRQKFHTRLTRLSQSLLYCFCRTKIEIVE